MKLLEVTCQSSIHYNTVYLFQEYLAGHIKMQHPEMPAEDSEVLAVSYMKDYLQGIYPKLADDFESLPEAPFTRHNVKKGKMCICQHLEQVIRNQNIA